MALYSNPPHRVTTYSSRSDRDTGGGTTLVYTAVQAAVPCSINTASDQEIEHFMQQSIHVTHVVAFLSSALTTALSEGWKLVTDDTSEHYHIRGIRKGRAYGSIPQFVYATCELQL